VPDQEEGFKISIKFYFSIKTNRPNKIRKSQARHITEL